MIVRIVRNYDYPDLFRQTPGDLGIWDNIKFTEDEVDECDYLIVLNSPHKEIKIKCPDGNKWLFSQESPIDMYSWHLDSFAHFDKVFTFWDKSLAPNIINLQTALPWHIGKTFDELVAMKIDDIITLKKDKVSWVTSNASHKQGHKLRLKLMEYLNIDKFDYDLFGRGFTPIKDKFDGIFPYKYSFAIENYSCNDYWTEKISDCFLSWTIPIYYGAKNILSDFPTNSIISIDANNEKETLKIIRNAIDNDFYANNINALAEARDLVLNKYQFFPHICNLINKYPVRENVKRIEFVIPQNPFYRNSNIFNKFKRKIINLMK